jgi:hypothetical protein
MVGGFYIQNRAMESLETALSGAGRGVKEKK